MKISVRIALAPVLLAALISCEGASLKSITTATVSGAGGPVTAAQAAKAAQTTTGAVDVVMFHSQWWTTNGSNVSFGAAGLSMSGTLTISGPNNTFGLAITLSNYTDAATGYKANGTINYTLLLNTTSGAATGAVTGSVTMSGGPVVTLGANTTFSSTSSWDYVFTGTITCNGTAFNATGLLSSSVQADAAAQAVLLAISIVTSGSSSWLSSGPVSYTGTGANAGLSMTGNLVIGSTDSLTMNITLASPYVSPAGFTMTGAVTFSVMGNIGLTSFTSGTLSGTVNTGGPVATQTWNVTNITGMSTEPTFTGTITCNGAAFDAKAE